MRGVLLPSLETREGAVGIVEVKSGFEALRPLLRECLEPIVTDLNTPDINGERVCIVKSSTRSGRSRPGPVSRRPLASKRCRAGAQPTKRPRRRSAGSCAS